MYKRSKSTAVATYQKAREAATSMFTSLAKSCPL